MQWTWSHCWAQLKQASTHVHGHTPSGLPPAGAPWPPPATQLAPLPVTAVFHSPLARAAQTARAICEGRAVPATQLPALREVDLYGFQVGMARAISALDSDMM